MKDIHDFAMAALPGIMLEVLVTKKELEPEHLADRSYKIGEAMLEQAKKRGWEPIGANIVRDSNDLSDSIAEADAQWEKMQQREHKIAYDETGEPVEPDFENEDDDDFPDNEDDDDEESRQIREELEDIQESWRNA